MQLAPDTGTPNGDVQDALGDDGQRARVLGRVDRHHDASLLTLSQLEDPAGSDVAPGLDLDRDVLAGLRQLLDFHVERQFPSQLRPSGNTR